MNRVEVFSLDRRFKPFEKSIQKSARRILRTLNKNDILAEIYLINSRKMRFLNKKFRGKNKTTTILSFEEPRNFIFPHTKRGLVPSARKKYLSSFGVGVFPSKLKRIGEIYLKFPITNYPINHLLIHGLLHLLGYNHSNKNDKIRMEVREDWLIRELGN